MYDTKTDSNGIARIPDLTPEGHIIEATAPGYLFLFEQFDVVADSKDPIEIEMIPNNGNINTGPVVNSAPPPGAPPRP